MTRVPAYFDAFLAAIAGGADIDHVHLGHWDAPGSVGPTRARAGFAQAQARLSECLIERLDMAPGHRVLDVGCGFGGTLRALRRRHPDAAVFGLNIDPRQLAVGLRRDGRTGNAAWVAGDACRLPFAAVAFDRVLCVEAAFHFPSRRAFLAEAHRVLRDGGVLVMSDILLLRPPLPPERIAVLEQRLDAGFGPWPDKWATLDDITRDAEETGFSLRSTDATAHTGPSYHVIAPDGRGDPAGTVLRDLHRLGCLRYLYLRLDRR